MSLILLNLESNKQIKLDGQKPLVIGRKNIDGCSDKRVSRNHGRVTCTDDGKLRLEALHCNPCFFTRNGVPPVLQLNKDEEETLNEGDYLGLLPNAFWFKITSNKKIKTNNSDNTITNQDSEENNRTSVSDENRSVTNSELDRTMTVKTEIESAPNDQHSTGCVSPSCVPSSGTNSAGLSGFGSAELEKTRLLPLWMYEIDEPTDRGSNKRSAPSTWEREKKQKVSGETVSEIKTEVKAETSNLDCPSTSKVDVIDEVLNITGDSEKTDQRELSSNKEGCGNDINSEGDGAGRRPICQYEANCYRQNSQHKLEFCHPGDSDYVPYEERPLCQYGATCYRRNEKHRVEFRHPPCGSGSRKHSSSRPKIAASPLPPKRSRKNNKVQNYEDEDEDEFDLEEPFASDASSDEYVPSECEEEEEIRDDD